MFLLALLACGPAPFPIPPAPGDETGTPSDDTGDPATDSGDSDTPVDTAHPCDEVPRDDAGYAALYDPTVLHELTLTVAQADLDALLVTPDEYVAADLKLDGEDFPDVGLRLRGATEQYRWDGKPSLKIGLRTFDDCNALGGVSHLALDGGTDDPAQLKEVLAATVFEDLGVISPRAAFATVTVNGESFGLYTNVELVDDAFVDRHWPAEDVVLWEGGDTADLSEAALSDWDEVHGDGDPASLTAVAEVVATAGDDFYAQADALVAMDDVLATWAALAAVGHDQSWPYEAGDVYLYAPASDPRLRFIPWDVDEGWDPKFTWNGAAAALGARCVWDPTCEAVLRDHVRDAADAVEALHVRTTASALNTLTSAAVAADTHRDTSAQSVTSARTALLADLDAWPDTLRAQLAE